MMFLSTRGAINASVSSVTGHITSNVYAWDAPHGMPRIFKFLLQGARTTSDVLTHWLPN